MEKKDEPLFSAAGNRVVYVYPQFLSVIFRLPLKVLHYPGLLKPVVPQCQILYRPVVFRYLVQPIIYKSTVISSPNQPPPRYCCFSTEPETQTLPPN